MPNVYLPVPHYKQSHPGKCLPACVRMVLAYWDDVRAETIISRQLRSRSFGTYVTNVRHLAEWGYQITDEPGTPASLQEHIQHGKPSIVLIRTGALPYTQEDVAHALVVTGLEPDAYIVHDPAMDEAGLSISHNALLLAWSEFDYRYVIIYPA